MGGMARGLAGAVTAMALCAAGCGGDSSSAGSADWKKDVRAQSTRLGALGTEVGNAVQGARNKTDAQLASEFLGLAGEARSLATDLDALDVPDSAHDEVAAMSQALRDGERDLRTVAAAATSHDATAARTATVQLIDDSRLIKQARDALDAVAK